MSTSCGASGWRRAKLSRWRVRRVARSMPAMAASIRRPRTSSGPARRRISSMLALMIWSRLLKSCATPPVNCPSPSIRLAWRAIASARVRRVMSAASRTWPPSGMRDRQSSTTRSATWTSWLAGVAEGGGVASGASVQSDAAPTKRAQGVPLRAMSAGKPTMSKNRRFQTTSAPPASNTAMPSRRLSTVPASRPRSSSSAAAIRTMRSRRTSRPATAAVSSSRPTMVTNSPQSAARLSCSRTAATFSSRSRVAAATIRATRSRAADIASRPPSSSSSAKAASLPALRATSTARAAVASRLTARLSSASASPAQRRAVLEGVRQTAESGRAPRLRAQVRLQVFRPHRQHEAALPGLGVPAARRAPRRRPSPGRWRGWPALGPERTASVTWVVRKMAAGPGDDDDHGPVRRAGCAAAARARSRCRPDRVFQALHEGGMGHEVGVVVGTISRGTRAASTW